MVAEMLAYYGLAEIRTDEEMQILLQTIDKSKNGKFNFPDLMIAFQQLNPAKILPKNQQQTLLVKKTIKETSPTKKTLNKDISPFVGLTKGECFLLD